MANDKFSTKDSLRYGWETYKAHRGFFAAYIVIFALINIGPDVIVNRIFEFKSVGWFAAKTALWLFGLIIAMVTTRIALNIHDQGQPELSNLSEIIPNLAAYIGGKILYFVIIFLGTVLLIVPGVIASYMFLYVGYIVTDRGLGPIAALGESRILTDGYKTDLLWFSLAILALNAPGILLLWLGGALQVAVLGLLGLVLMLALFVTVPVTIMSSAYIYRRLSPADAAVETA